MLAELQTLLAYVPEPDAKPADYLRVIVDDNALRKPSGKTRLLTYRHLVDLYALDPSVLVYRSLRYLWDRDPDSRPMLALLCAYCRDALLRSSSTFILPVDEGAVVTRQDLEAYLEAREPGRFSPATLKSTAQNINSTWTQSGHLAGKARKVRTVAVPTPGAVAYALLLGYLTGGRGELLFSTDYTRLLDCPIGKAIDLAEEASRRGWFVFKRVGSVIDVAFPNLISNQEMEWLREQS